MSKRFVDTEMFDDPFFMDLSKDGKIGFMYFITKCNHAGLLEVNEKLFKVYTGVDWTTVKEQLNNRIVTVKEGLYFMPNFIRFQYPSWPNSKVYQQQSAIELLSKYGLLDENSCLTVNEQLNKGYVNVSVDVRIKKKSVSDFYKEELELSDNNPEYKKYIDFLFGDNDTHEPLKRVLAIKTQCTYDQFVTIYNKCLKYGYNLNSYLLGVDDYTDKKYESLPRVLNRWIDKDFEKKTK